MNQRICQAIEAKRRLEFDYDGLPREVEPHAHGLSSAGNEVVRGFQTGGESSSEELGWRLWRVDKMVSLNVSDSTFSNTRSGYSQGDSQMHPVHCEL